jgi:hypothetical protein
MKWQDTRVAKCPLKSAEQWWGDWDIVWEHVHISLDEPEIGLAYFIAQKQEAFAVINYSWNHEPDMPQELRETKYSFMFPSSHTLAMWLMYHGPRELGPAISKRMLENVKGL